MSSPRAELQLTPREHHHSSLKPPTTALTPKERPSSLSPPTSTCPGTPRSWATTFDLRTGERIKGAPQNFRLGDMVACWLTPDHHHDKRLGTIKLFDGSRSKPYRVETYVRTNNLKSITMKQSGENIARQNVKVVWLAEQDLKATIFCKFCVEACGFCSWTKEYSSLLKLESQHRIGKDKCKYVRRAEGKQRRGLNRMKKKGQEKNGVKCPNEKCKYRCDSQLRLQMHLKHRKHKACMQVSRAIRRAKEMPVGGWRFVCDCRTGPHAFSFNSLLLVRSHQVSSKCQTLKESPRIHRQVSRLSIQTNEKELKVSRRPKKTVHERYKIQLKKPKEPDAASNAEPLWEDTDAWPTSNTSVIDGPTIQLSPSLINVQKPSEDSDDEGPGEIIDVDDEKTHMLDESDHSERFELNTNMHSPSCYSERLLPEVPDDEKTHENTGFEVEITTAARTKAVEQPPHATPAIIPRRESLKEPELIEKKVPSSSPTSVVGTTPRTRTPSRDAAAHEQDHILSPSVVKTNPHSIDVDMDFDITNRSVPSFISVSPMGAGEKSLQICTKPTSLKIQEMEQRIRKHLEQLEYGSPNDALALICKALLHYKTLDVEPESPYYNPKAALSHFDPKSELVMHGTIPVSYEETSYNIPVALWLHSSLPQKDPIVFVTPGDDQKFAPNHSHVDQFGRVATNEWSKLNAERTIVSLIQYVQQVFEKQPPLYKKKDTDYDTAVSEIGSRVVLQEPGADPRADGSIPVLGKVVHIHKNYCEVEMDGYKRSVKIGKAYLTLWSKTDMESAQKGCSCSISCFW